MQATGEGQGQLQAMDTDSRIARVFRRAAGNPDAPDLVQARRDRPVFASEGRRRHRARFVGPHSVEAGEVIAQAHPIP